MSGLLWALVLLPLGGGALLACAGRRADRLAAPVAVALGAVDLALGCVAAVVRPAAKAPLLAGLPFHLRIDGLSALLVVTVTAVAAVVLLFSVWSIGPGEARARFFGLMLLFSGAMLTTVTAADLLTLLMGWEVMGAVSWALIGYWWREPRRVRAAGTAFLTTRTADVGLYVAAGAALAGVPSGSLALDRLHTADEPWLSVVCAGVVVAALGKSAQLPFSHWLSRAMQGPSPVSALLHSATMVVAGAYLLLRLEPLLRASGWGAPLVAWTGAVTALALGLVAVAQRDLKQLLAASSCAQIGFMVLAAGAGGLAGGTLQLMAHAAAKSLAFLVAGAWLTLLGTQVLPALRGAARADRATGAAFVVAALTLAGLPPLALWAAKDLVLAAAAQHGPWLYATGLAAAVVSAVYATRALWFVLVGERERAGNPPLFARLALVPLAAACPLLTFVAFPPLHDAFVRVLGAGPQVEPHGAEFVLSAALALLASAVCWRWGAVGAPLPRPVRAWFADWLGLTTAVRVLVVRPVLATAGALAAFDDRVLDRAVTASVRGAVRLARWVDAAVERRVDRAVHGVAGATARLGRLARRPQTGEVHQYLAQAVSAFAVLSVVLVLFVVLTGPG
ncbi:proton-conducting transporter membrane subunit [Streptomyces sp. NPDC020412]|uniref:proton-conducting transporter transmembrane domain-containing protein n=1 Tax=Streptomyces sp. NPDC020412 TaxID=3365073 RepID=UPI0037BD09D9